MVVPIVNSQFCNGTFPALPEHMGMYLVIVKKLDPDWVWSLKCAKRPHQDNKSFYDYRLFDQAVAEEMGIRVAHYDSLNDYPDLILYHGFSDKHGYEFEIERYAQPERAA